MNTKELREKRAALVAEMRKISDKAGAEKRAFSAEEQSAWDKYNAEVDALAKTIDAGERQAKLDAELAAPAHPPPANGEHPGQRSEPPGTFAQALRAYARGQEIPANCRTFARLAADAEHGRVLEIPLLNSDGLRALKRDIAVGTSNAPVTNVFVADLERALLAFGSVRQVARVLRTADGRQIKYPFINDTGNSGALLAEATTIGSSVDPTFGATTLDAYKYSSKPILYTPELVEDSVYDIETELVNDLVERLARGMNAANTTADGSSKPNGIVTASSLGVTAAATGTVTADELLELQHSVDPAYRPAAGWMLNDTTLLALRKLKDGNGVYLWQAGLVANVPDRLCGQPGYVNQQMASMSAGTKPIIYGDFGKYLIRDVGGLRLRRLTERYADTDQLALIAFMRMDSDLRDAGTHPVKHLIMHA